MSNLHILFLEPQPCIRALKYAMGLKSYFKDAISLCFGYLGYSLNRLYGFGDEYFDRMVKLNSGKTDEIQSLIKDFNPVIIHSHNAPNTLTLAATSATDKIPVIHDVHEVLSVHNSGFSVNDETGFLAKYRAEEKKANEESDGRIYVSEGIKDYIHDHYAVNEEEEIVFRNYVSESVMPKHFREKLSKIDGEVHIAYTGCVTSVVEDSHYDLRSIFQEIADHQMHIHIYPSSNIITQSNDDYRELAEANEFMHFHNHLDHKSLLKEITQYDYGWAGFNGVENKKHTDIAFQNKIIEYVCCGLPVLAFPHKTIKSFIEKHGVGIVFQDVDDLEKRLKKEDFSQIKGKTLRCRDKFSIEKRIPKVVQFYRKMIRRKNG